jgi:hypothetical protein
MWLRLGILAIFLASSVSLAKEGLNIRLAECIGEIQQVQKLSMTPYTYFHVGISQIVTSQGGETRVYTDNGATTVGKGCEFDQNKKLADGLQEIAYKSFMMIDAGPMSPLDTKMRQNAKNAAVKMLRACQKAEPGFSAFAEEHIAKLSSTTPSAAGRDSSIQVTK